MKAYYFSGWFVTRAYATMESEEDLTEDQLEDYLSDNLYDLDWEWGRKGEITDAKFDGVEETWMSTFENYKDFGGYDLHWDGKAFKLEVNYVDSYYGEGFSSFDAVEVYENLKEYFKGTEFE